MKQYLLITQKNLNTQEETKLAEGQVEVDKTKKGISFEYEEINLGGRVQVVLNEDDCRIKRHFEITTHLHFIENKKTLGTVDSEFGTFDFEIFTHKYRRWNEVTALEYDILNGEEVSDSFRLMFRFKKLS